MKILIYVLLLAFLTICSGFLLPQWWAVAFIGFVVAIAFKEGMGKSALITFLTVGLIWFLVAFNIDAANESILSTRIGELFGIGSLGITLVSALIGGLAAMFGALTGASLQKVISES